MRLGMRKLLAKIFDVEAFREGFTLIVTLWTCLCIAIFMLFLTGMAIYEVLAVLGLIEIGG